MVIVLELDLVLVANGAGLRSIAKLCYIEPYQTLVKRADTEELQVAKG